MAEGRATSPITADPTARQLQTLREIDRLARAKGYPPSIVELGAVLGIKSKNGVADLLWSLRRRGAITWERSKARTVLLTDYGRQLLGADREVA